MSIGGASIYKLGFLGQDETGKETIEKAGRDPELEWTRADSSRR